MSISTYGELKTAVGVWLNRSDLTAYIPDFIRLGEQRMNYGSDDPYPSVPLRIPSMQNRATGTITSSAIAFPTGFLEPLRVAASSGGSDWTLMYITPERYSEHSNSSGVPTVYTYLNNEIETSGTGGADYILDYYKAFTALSADADTNWVLANAPGLYLYSALLESAPFIGDVGTLTAWLSMYKAGIAAVNRATKYQGGGSLATRVAM
jgi:hypothetical protein